LPPDCCAISAPRQQGFQLRQPFGIKRVGVQVFNHPGQSGFGLPDIAGVVCVGDLVLLGTSKNRRFQPATVSSGLKSSGLPVL
jgi:hypothetical protein